MASKVLEHPFDLTKVRLQSQVLDSAPRYQGPIDCLTKAWKHEGVRGLYRVRDAWLGKFLRNTDKIRQGLPAPVFGAMCENATLFVVYNRLQLAVRWASGTQPDVPLGLRHIAIAAAGAGSVVSFILYEGCSLGPSRSADVSLLM